MIGVFANAVAILIGTLLGLLFKRHISKTITERSERALGFCTLIIGMKMAVNFEHVLVLILCVTLGGIIGTLLEIETRTQRFARKIQSRFSKSGKDDFVLGFSTASILYCSGAMAVIGSINAGASGNNEVLLTKTMLDGVMSVVLASLYGAGVAFSAAVVFLYEGAITIAASHLQALSSPKVLNEISEVGGVLLTMIGFNLVGATKIPVADFVPAVGLAIIAGFWI